ISGVAGMIGNREQVHEFGENLLLVSATVGAQLLAEGRWWILCNAWPHREKKYRDGYDFHGLRRILTQLTAATITWPEFLSAQCRPANGRHTSVDLHPIRRMHVLAAMRRLM